MSCTLGELVMLGKRKTDVLKRKSVTQLLNSQERVETLIPYRSCVSHDIAKRNNTGLRCDEGDQTFACVCVCVC